MVQPPLCPAHASSACRHALAVLGYLHGPLRMLQASCSAAQPVLAPCCMAAEPAGAGLWMACQLVGLATPGTQHD